MGEAPAARCPDSPPLGFTPQQWQAFVSLRVRCGLKGDVTDREQRLYASLFAQGLTAELLTADLEAWLASEGRKRIHSMVYFAERLRQVIADPATEPATPEPVKELPKMGAADKQPLWGCWFKFAGEGDWVKADAQWVWAAEWYRKRGWADEDIPAQLIADLQGESQWRGWRIPQRPADVPLAAYQRTPGGASLLTDYPVH